MVNSAQKIGGPAALFDALEPLLDRSLTVKVRDLALTALANSLAVVFATNSKDAYSQALAETGILNGVLASLDERGLQEQAARFIFYAAPEPRFQEKLKETQVSHGNRIISQHYWYYACLPSSSLRVDGLGMVTDL